MKKIIIACVLATAFAALFGSSTNLENIYGRNDLDINNNYAAIYGNNYGSLIENDNLTPRSMDIEAAQKEIELLNERNSSFQRENSSYEGEIEKVQTLAGELYNHIEKIDELLNSVVSSATELYSVSITLTDPSMRNEIQASIVENRQQKYDLDNRRTELAGRLSSLGEIIAVKKKYIAVNNLNLKKNLERIDFLKACIELSSKDSRALSRVVSRSAELQGEVDSILSKSFE